MHSLPARSPTQFSKRTEKHWLTVRAKDFPAGISTSVNAREPVGLNRLVYRDVRESLEGTELKPGSFDLMNKGITILAVSARLVDKDEEIYEIVIDDEEGGIVDGAHTAKIIEQCNAEKTTHPESIRRGVHPHRRRGRSGY